MHRPNNQEPEELSDEQFSRETLEDYRRANVLVHEGVYDRGGLYFYPFKTLLNRLQKPV
jgi:hypothetical protein